MVKKKKIILQLLILPNEHNSHCDNLGDLGDQAMSPCNERRRPGKKVAQILGSPVFLEPIFHSVHARYKNYLDNVFVFIYTYF